MNSIKGFATILMLSLLPVLLAGGLLVTTLFSFLKADLSVLNVCRALQLEVQSKAARNLEKLLKLNPRALKLRISQRKVEKALTLAMKSGNPAALAAAEAFLLKVQMQRQALDLRQRSLIEAANRALSLGGSELPRHMLQEWKDHMHPLHSWIHSRLQLTDSQVPLLPVRPDFVEIAPLYELQSPFEDLQTWNQHWVLEFNTDSWAKRFLKFHGRFQRSCSTSLYAEDALWVAKLKKVKSLWRGSS